MAPLSVAARTPGKRARSSAGSQPASRRPRPRRVWDTAQAAQVSDTSYHIIGSFNSWKEPVQMEVLSLRRHFCWDEVEAQGVYGFTVVLGLESQSFWSFA